jgi:hypothetical protein
MRPTPACAGPVPYAIRFAAAVCTLVSLLACADSYCGAPCEAMRRPKAPADEHVNQYGSLYGWKEVDSLTRSQLAIEKNSLEFLLKADARDAEILAALKAEGDSAYAFRYDDYSTGGNRFDASGKLRRRETTEAGSKRIARLVGESGNRELFERYRQVRWRLIRQEKSDALAAPPPPDTSWAGGYRAGSAPLAAAPEKFPDADSCARWAEREAEAYRKRAYAFEFECRMGTAVVKRKIW